MTLWSTTSTFGSNSKELSIGNPVIYRATDVGGNKRILAMLVTSVASTGPTQGVCVDPSSDPPNLPVGDGSTVIPFDDLATDEDDLRVNHWIPVKAPPVR